MKITGAMIEAGAEVLAGEPRYVYERAVKMDKWHDSCDQAREVFEAMIRASTEPEEQG